MSEAVQAKSRKSDRQAGGIHLARTLKAFHKVRKQTQIEIACYKTETKIESPKVVRSFHEHLL